MQIIKIHPLDNVVVALKDIEKETVLNVDGDKITVAEDIKRGHKICISFIKA